MKPYEYSFHADANFIASLSDWIKIYGILMRQAANGEQNKQEVIKACKRALEDLEGDS